MITTVSESAGVEFPLGPPVSWSERRRKVTRNSWSIGVAVGAYGISFGALASAAGLSVVQACALSVLAFTGGSQLALVGILGTGGAVASGVATALLLGVRNALYGLRIAPILGERWPRKFLAAQLVIDETTAMTVANDDDQRAARLGFWTTALAVFTLWNLSTFVGALVTTRIASPTTLGLDAAVPAAFLALLAPRLRGRRAWFCAVAAAVVALMLTPWVPAGVPVLAAGCVAVAVGLVTTSDEDLP